MSVIIKYACYNESILQTIQIEKSNDHKHSASKRVTLNDTV